MRASQGRSPLPATPEDGDSASPLLPWASIAGRGDVASPRPLLPLISPSAREPGREGAGMRPCCPLQLPPAMTPGTQTPAMPRPLAAPGQSQVPHWHTQTLTPAGSQGTRSREQNWTWRWHSNPSPLMQDVARPVTDDRPNQDPKHRPRALPAHKASWKSAIRKDDFTPPTARRGP